MKTGGENVNYFETCVMRYRHLFRKQKDTGWIPARDTRIPGVALGWASGIKLYQINLVHPPLVRREQSEVASVLKPMYNQIIYVIHSVKYFEKKHQMFDHTLILWVLIPKTCNCSNI